jgi:hypothetical protein
MFLRCLHYGMMDTDSTELEGAAISQLYPPLSRPPLREIADSLSQALELPQSTSINIFQRKDGSVMVTMVRLFRRVEG